MSSAEFTRWIAYSHLEPFGFHVDNFRMGQIASTVFNVSRTKKTSPLAPAAFYPERKALKRKRELSKRQQEYVAKRRESDSQKSAKQATKRDQKRKR